jgi:hypothetical protein
MHKIYKNKVTSNKPEKFNKTAAEKKSIIKMERVDCWGGGRGFKTFRGNIKHARK